MQHSQCAESMENTSFAAGKISFCLSIHESKYSSLCSSVWERLCSKSHQLQTIFPSLGWHTQTVPCRRPEIPGKQRDWAGWDVPELNPNQTSPKQGRDSCSYRIPSPRGSQIPAWSSCARAHPCAFARSILALPAGTPRIQLCLQIPFSAPSWAGLRDAGSSHPPPKPSGKESQSFSCVHIDAELPKIIKGDL